MEVKPLLTCLFLLTGLGFSASAQTAASPGTTASVTSTIRVRIPAFASLTLAENRTAAVSPANFVLSAPTSKKVHDNQLQANQRWIVQVDKGLVPDDLKLKRNDEKRQAVEVVYTMTAQ